MSTTGARIAMASLLAVVAGCGSSGNTQPDGSHQIDAAKDAPSSGAIPAAGTSDQVDNNFGDVEPNNTPSQATPLGTAVASVYTWVSGNTIGGSDTADYFVFDSSAAGGMFTLGASGLCYTGSITSLTATLWKVAAGQEVLPPVGTWTSSTGSCTSGTATLEASTEYLLEVTAAGGTGMYAA